MIVYCNVMKYSVVQDNIIQELFEFKLLFLEKKRKNKKAFAVPFAFNTVVVVVAT